GTERARHRARCLPAWLARAGILELVDHRDLERERRAAQGRRQWHYLLRLADHLERLPVERRVACARAHVERGDAPVGADREPHHHLALPVVVEGDTRVALVAARGLDELRPIRIDGPRFLALAPCIGALGCGRRVRRLWRSSRGRRLRWRFWFALGLERRWRRRRQ